MYFNGKLHYLLIFLIISSCIPRRIIVNHSDLVNTFYFQKKIKSLNKKGALTISERRQLLKLYVEYGYGFILEDVDRLLYNDYEEGVKRASEAYSLFTDAKELGNLILSEQYPTFELWLSGKKSNIQFNNDNIHELYWLAAAYGGAIRASRGKPLDLIQLPTVGKLLTTALSLDAGWNRGAIYSAMIGYTATRSDLTDDALIDSVTKYYEISISLSDSMDASPFVSFAENIDKKYQYKSEYIKKLKYVTNMNVNQDRELRLGNIIAQERAKWLLTKTDEYFFE